jgi:hypothetical protein
VSPKSVKTSPENIIHVACGMTMKSVVTLRSTVNNTIEIVIERMVTYGSNRDPRSAVTPRTTGRMGRMHGARTVSMPDTSATRASVMRYMV